jgi:hypothetical protein
MRPMRWLWQIARGGQFIAIARFRLSSGIILRIDDNLS